MSFSQYPQNPVIGQEYTVGTMIVTWDGTKFVSVPPNDIVTSSELSLAVAAIDADRVAAENASDAAVNAAAIAVQYPEGQLAASLALREQINRKATLDLRFNENQHRVYELFGLTDKLLTDVVSTTRASTATYNSLFGVATAAVNTPRIEYDPATGEPLGLLCEEQRTNLLLWSEDFSNAIWPKTNSTVIANNAVAPDENLTADKLVEDVTNGVHQITQLASVISGNLYTVTIYAKASERASFALRMNSAGYGALVTASFNLSARTATIATAGTSTSASIDDAGNGWFRCRLTSQAVATTTTTHLIMLENQPGTRTYTGDGASGVYIWGAQLEVGSFPTSYIKTEESQVTRADDLISASQQHNPSAFSVFGDLSFISTAPARRILSIGNSNADRMEVSNSTVVFSANNVSQTYTIPEGLRPPQRKIAYSYFNGLVKVFINGELRHTFSQAVATSLPSTRFSINYGASASLTTVSSVKVKEAKYFPRALSDAELAELTRL